MGKRCSVTRIMGMPDWVVSIAEGFSPLPFFLSDVRPGLQRQPSAETLLFVHDVDHPVQNSHLHIPQPVQHGCEDSLFLDAPVPIHPLGIHRSSCYKPR
jgi:hypothetical protein